MQEMWLPAELLIDPYHKLVSQKLGGAGNCKETTSSKLLFSKIQAPETSKLFCQEFRVGSGGILIFMKKSMKKSMIGAKKFPRAARAIISSWI